MVKGAGVCWIQVKILRVMYVKKVLNCFYDFGTYDPQRVTQK
jgi:hypothetical protein